MSKESRGKLAPLLPSIRSVFHRMGWMKWVVASLIIAVFSSLSAFLVWTQLRPIDRFRPEILRVIQEQSGAELATMSRVSWAYDWSSFSFGFQSKKIELSQAKFLSFGQIEDVRLLFSPLHLLVGKANVHLEIGSFSANLIRSDRTTQSLFKIDELWPVNSWSKLLQLEVNVRKFKVAADKGFLGYSPSEDRFSISKSQLKIKSVGIPGDIQIKLNGDLDVNLSNGAWLVRGPFLLESKGYFQSENDRIVGLVFDEVAADFSKSYLSLAHIVEKPTWMPLKSSFKSQLVFKSKIGLSSFTLSNGELNFLDLPVVLQGKYEFGEGLGLGWGLPRREVKKQKLPLKFLNKTEVTGLVESVGHFKIEDYSISEMNWNLMLNNLKIPVSAFEPHVRSSSKGNLLLSFVAQGGVRSGRHFADKVEVQATAKDTEVDFKFGKMHKPLGDNLDLFLKAHLKNDVLSIDRFSTHLHAMKVEGKGQISDFHKLFEKNEEAQLRFGFHSNRLDLSEWSPYFKLFQQNPPLRGGFECNASLNVPLKNFDYDFDRLRWRIDKIALTNVKGSFNRSSLIELGVADPANFINGPFSLDLILKGRGTGNQIEKSRVNLLADLGQANFVFRETVQKPTGIPFRLKADLRSTKNQLWVKDGHLRFHELEMDYLGELTQGSSSKIAIKMNKPVDLRKWRGLLRNELELPVRGQVKWNGSLVLDSSFGDFDKSIDWRDIGLDGRLKFINVAGLPWSMEKPVKNLSGELHLKKGYLVLKKVNLQFSDESHVVSGRLKLKSSKRREALSVHSLFKNPSWIGSLQWESDNLDVDSYASIETQGRNFYSWLVDRWSSSEFFRMSRVGGEFNFKKFQLSNVTAHDLSGVWKSHGDGVKINILKGKVFSGSLKGEAMLEKERASTPSEKLAMSLNFNLEKVRLQELLSTVAPEISRMVAGVFDTKLIISSSGRNPSEFGKNLRGRINGDLTAGRFKPFELLNSEIAEIKKNNGGRYLASRIDETNCVNGDIQGRVDIVLQDGNLQVASSEFEYPDSGSRIEWRGSYGGEGAYGIEGQLFPGKRCFMREAQLCLASEDSFLPFTVLGDEDLPRLNFTPNENFQEIEGCIAGNVQKKVRSRNRVQRLPTSKMNSLLKGKK